ncbi:DNA ligase [Rhodococcus wratislaviensis]|nr:DNA ligase [Rhodococcus wratislaviensis]
MSRLIAPMLATAGPPPDDDRSWSFEMKYDGCRLLASVGGGREPELWTRNLNIVTASYPEVAEALSTAFGGGGGRIVLDGEIVAMDRGRPSFGLLQRRLGVAHATKPLQRRIPVTYLPFDALVRSGVELLQVPYLDRRAELAELGSVIEKIGGLPITVPPSWDSQNGRVMLNAARSAQMEGIVAKRSNSMYFAGQRNRAWIKTAIRTRGTVLAIGFVGSSRSVATLVLGAYTADGQLEQVGHVSSGLSVAARRRLREEFRALERPTSPLEGDPAAAPDGYGEGDVSWLTPVTGGRGRFPRTHLGWAHTSLVQGHTPRYRPRAGPGRGSVEGRGKPPTMLSPQDHQQAVLNAARARDWVAVTELREAGERCTRSRTSHVAVTTLSARRRSLPPT